MTLLTLQLNINTSLLILVHVKIVVFSTKICLLFSKKNFSFNFIFVLDFFQNYAELLEFTKIYFDIQYFANRGHTSSLLN